MIDVINQGQVAHHVVPRLYELNRHIDFDNMVIFDYEPAEALMYFQQYPNTAYVDPQLVTIPECRCIGGTGNPYYMANGMRMLDVIGEGTPAQAQFLGDSVIEIFQEEHGVEILRNVKTREILEDIIIDGLIQSQGTGKFEDYVEGDKLYFMDGAKKVKFFSPQLLTHGHLLWTYILFDKNLNYNKFLDFYNEESVAEWSSDPDAYGIDAIIPRINVDVIMNKILNRFISKLGESRNNRPLTQAENAEMIRMRPTHLSTGWIENANRTLPAPFYENDTEMTKIEVEFPDLASVPTTLEFDIEVGEGTVRAQVATGEKDSYTPDHFKGSHIVHSYQTGRKLITIYKGYVTDANGDKRWCSQEMTDTLLTVTLPQAWMAAATYPVIYDPNIGYDTIGGSTITNSNVVRFKSLIPTFDAQLNAQDASTQAYHYGGIYTNGNHKMALYTFIPGEFIAAGTIKMASDESTSNVNPAAWHAHKYITGFGIPYTMNDSIQHMLASWAGSGGYGSIIHYDTGVLGDGATSLITTTYVNGNGFNGWPSSEAYSSNSHLYSIYTTSIDVTPDAHSVIEMQGDGIINLQGEGIIQMK